MDINFENKNFFVTGGAGFIGSAFIIKLNSMIKGKILNFDKLSCQSSPEFLDNLNNYHLEKGDLENIDEIKESLNKFKPNYIIHFAAESHVDRSIKKPDKFIQSNTLGTFNLLHSVQVLQEKKILSNDLRVLNISTDEVYGSLKDDEKLFDENSQFNPSSAYSASKASADMFVNSFYKTYGMKVQTTHCSNNFGPRQFPEKLIPSSIYKFINDLPIKVFGDGNNIRDWIFVDDHVDCLINILNNDFIPGRYNIGGSSEIRNLDIINKIKKILVSKFNIITKSQIEFIRDRLGHDYRYGIDSSKVNKYFNWTAKNNFDDALYLTIKWYIENDEWLKSAYNKQRDSDLI